VKKRRLDLEVTARGLIHDQENPKAYIMAGEVLVDGQVEYRPHRLITEKNRVEIKIKKPFVSRGAFKLERAIKDFSIEIAGTRCLDVGISTGGFTDYLLKQGALEVTGVDVNTDQVDFNLRKDPRVKLIKTNARFLEVGALDYEPDLITMDVSFISITRILPALAAFKKARIISLIKPQFEARKEEVGPGGIIKERDKRLEILLRLKESISQLGFSVTAVTQAGVKGRRGNQEYFFLIKYGQNFPISDKIIDDAVEI